MEFIPLNLFDFLTITPNLVYLVPEVFQKSSVRNPLAVTLGAIAGALSRYYLSLWVTKALGTGFPYATMLINLTGSFLMGLITTLIVERTLLISPEISLLITVGFLGSYTTFSSYELDTMNLLREFGWQTPTTLSMTLLLAVKPIFYWLGSAILGFLCLYLGTIVARTVR
jgi:fluoride exporter